MTQPQRRNLPHGVSWLDSNYSPPVLKRWDAAKEQWVRDSQSSEDPGYLRDDENYDPRPRVKMNPWPWAALGCVLLITLPFGIWKLWELVR